MKRFAAIVLMLAVLCAAMPGALTAQSRDLPDLEVTSVLTDEAAGHVGYRITNSGSAATSSVCYVALLVNGTTVATDRIGAVMAVGGVAEGWFAGYACAAGTTARVQVCVDSGDDISEADESNNCAWGTCSGPAVTPTPAVALSPTPFPTRGTAATPSVTPTPTPRIALTPSPTPRAAAATPTPERTDLLPDLIIRGVLCSDATGQIGYGIVNAGDASAPAGHETVLWVNGERVATDYVRTEISPDTTLERWFTGYSCPAGATVRVELCADANDGVAESSERNNCANGQCQGPDRPAPTPTTAVTPDTWRRVQRTPAPDLPDLHVRGVLGDEDRGLIGYGIVNVGEATARGGHYSVLWIDGREAARDLIDTELPVGITLERWFEGYDWDGRTPVAVTVIADAGRVVAESNENNNDGYARLGGGGDPRLRSNEVALSSDRKPDLMVRSIMYDEDSGLVGYAIANGGSLTAPAGHTTVLSIDGEAVARDILDARLDIGETETRWFKTHSRVHWRGSTTEVCADALDLVEEINERNNCRSDAPVAASTRSAYSERRTVTSRTRDINRDSSVDTRDLTMLRVLYGRSVIEPAFSEYADLNLDDMIDLKDLAMLGAFYNDEEESTPDTEAQIEASKVILSHLGETAQDARMVGDSIRYRIYYVDNSNGGEDSDLVILDKLDPALLGVSAHDGGVYDVDSHAVYWVIEGVGPGDGGFVEVEATAGNTDEVIDNKALLKVGGDVDPLSLDAATDGVTETNIVSTYVFAEPELGWVPFVEGAEPGTEPDVTMKDETTMDTMVNFDVPGMFVYQALKEGVAYQKLSVPGYETSLAVGKPELPMLGAVLEVPFGVDIDVDIYKSEYVELSDYNVFPAQEPWIAGEEDSHEFVIDEEVYLTDAFYPAELAAIDPKDTGVMRGHRLVFLKANTVQYNPVTRTLRAYSNIEVMLKYSEPAQVEEPDERVLSGAFEQLMSAAVLNHKPAIDHDELAVAMQAGQADAGPGHLGCQYLIITHSDFYDPVDPDNPVTRFRDWKQHKGISTCIVDTADIEDGDTSDGIKAYIQNAYDNWPTPPSYVLLVGDSEFVPTTHDTFHSAHDQTDPATGLDVPTETGSDLYYATVDGTDMLPDLLIGRVSVDTTNESETVFDKIIEYEKNPPANPDFYTDTALVRLFEDDTDAKFDAAGNPIPDPCPSDGQEDCHFGIIEVAEEVRDFLIAEGYDPRRIYNRTGNFPQGPLQYVDGTNLPANLTIAGGFPWNGGPADTQDAFNDGSFLVTFCGHGYRNGFFVPNFDVAHLAGLNNAGELPFSYASACNMGWFDNETDHNLLNTANNDECFAEEITRMNNGGVVGIIASSRISWFPHDVTNIEGMWDAIWPDFDPDVGTTPCYGVGLINTYSKLYLAKYRGASKAREEQFEVFHLFGDPEMPIWTEETGDFDVVHPEGIGSTGEQDFVVTVLDAVTGDPVHSAVVVLNKGSAIVAVEQTNPAGVARFTLGGFYPGPMDVTVTAHNWRPYEGSIYVSDDGAAINRLDPENGPEDQVVHVGGTGFSESEEVDVYFDTKLVATAVATGGEFGQAGQEHVDVKVPSPSDLGQVNVVARGKTSGRFAVDVFQVSTANPIDLYTYNQWDETTWHLHEENRKTWDNPEIQLYDEDDDPVSSKELAALEKYTVRARVHNDTGFDAENVKVTFRWADCGVGQSDKVWKDIGTDDIDVEAHDAEQAEVKWAPEKTGHICIKVFIYHVEDINGSNNSGQENCKVGETSSPAKLSFQVWNPTSEPVMVHLELRQVTERNGKGALWQTAIEHPDPQLIEPLGKSEAWVVIEPPDSVPAGQEAQFELTGYIDGEMIGGVTFVVTKAQ